MNVHICLITLFLIIINIYIVFFNDKVYTKCLGVFGKKEKNKQILFLIISLMILLFFAYFRDPFGEISTDYMTYKEIFRLADMPLFEYIDKFYQNDIGFLMLNKFLKLFTNNFNVLIFFFHLVIIGSFLYFFYKNSEIPWLSTLLLITIGSYYVSYNLIRQFLVVSLLLMSSKYLFERDFKKYLVIILSLMFLHKSVVIMIPMYFILDIDIFHAKNKKILYLLACTLILVFLNFDFIISLIQKMVYTTYIDGAFGSAKGSLTVLIRPIIILIFIIFTKRYYALDCSKNRIMINACIMWIIIGLFSYRMSILNRFIYYFIPYVLCYVPNVLVCIPKEKRKNYGVMILFFAVIYGVITQCTVVDFIQIF